MLFEQGIPVGQLDPVEAAEVALPSQSLVRHVDAGRLCPAAPLALAESMRLDNISRWTPPGVAPGGTANTSAPAPQRWLTQVDVNVSQDRGLVANPEPGLGQPVLNE